MASFLLCHPVWATGDGANWGLEPGEHRSCCHSRCAMCSKHPRASVAAVASLFSVWSYMPGQEKKLGLNILIVKLVAKGKLWSKITGWWLILKYTGENPSMQVNSFVMYILNTGLTSVSKWTGKRWAFPSVRGRCCPLPHVCSQNRFKRSIADEIYWVGSWWDWNPVPMHDQGWSELIQTYRRVSSSYSD